MERLEHQTNQGISATPTGQSKYLIVEEFDPAAAANYEFDILRFVASASKNHVMNQGGNNQLEISCVWRMELVGQNTWIRRDDHSYITYSACKNTTESYDWLKWYQSKDSTPDTNEVLLTMGRDGCVCFIPIIVHLLLYGFAAVHPHKQTGDGTWIFSWLPHAGFKLHKRARANTYVQYTPDSDFVLLPKASDLTKLINAIQKSKLREQKSKLREQYQEQIREEQRQAKYKREVEHIAELRSAAVFSARGQHPSRFQAEAKFLSQCKYLGIQAVPIIPSEYM